MIIPIQVPEGATVTGELLSSYAQWPGRMSQDLLQVHLANGRTIDVGWCPSWDALGTFQIVIYEHDWDNQIVDPITSVDPFDVAGIVQQLAYQHSGTGNAAIIFLDGSAELKAIGTTDSVSSTRAIDIPEVFPSPSYAVVQNNRNLFSIA
jgi:hypothetical protein